MAKKTYPSGVITPELGSTNWYSDYDTNSLLLDSNITKTNSLDSKVKELETNYTKVETSLTSLSAVAKSGDYNDLSNKPESIALAEKALADGDNNVITKTYATKKEVVTSLEPYVKKTELADVATSGSYTDLSNKPTTIAHADRATADKNGDVITVTYAKKTEIPNLDGYALSKDISKVGKTNNYKDLDNLPTIPSLDGYVTDVELSPVAKSGDYNDLSNTPEPVDLTPYATKEELTTKADDANVVHKTGNDIIVGTKTFSGEVQTNTIKAVGGGGANISLTPPDNGGFFAIRAFNGTVNKELVGYPNGMLAWDNNEILTRVNGVTLDTAQTITGAKTFTPWTTFSNGINVKWITGNKEQKALFLFSTMTDSYQGYGASLELHSETLNGGFGLTAKNKDGTNVKTLTGDSNGSLKWSTNNVLTDANQIMVLKNLTGAKITSGAVIDCGTGNGVLVGWFMNTAVTTQGYESREATNALANQVAQCCCQITRAVEEQGCQNRQLQRQIQAENVASQLCDAKAKIASLEAQQALSLSQQAQTAYLISQLKPTTAAGA